MLLNLRLLNTEMTESLPWRPPYGNWYQAPKMSHGGRSRQQLADLLAEFETKASYLFVMMTLAGQNWFTTGLIPWMLYLFENLSEDFPAFMYSK